MSEGLQAILNDDGVFEEYDDTYDLTIHCESEEEQEEILNKLNWRWIPVSEKLPENDEDVLVCFPQGGMAVAYYHIDDTHYPTQYEDLNETGWFNEEGGAFYFDPIAWMPLPQPYKAKSEE